MFHLPTSARIILTPQTLSIFSPKALYHSLPFQNFRIQLAGDLSTIYWNFVPEEKILSAEFQLTIDPKDFARWLRKRSGWTIQLTDTLRLNENQISGNAWLWGKDEFQIEGEWKITRNQMQFHPHSDGALFRWFLQRICSYRFDFFSIPWVISVDFSSPHIQVRGSVP